MECLQCFFNISFFLFSLLLLLLLPSILPPHPDKGWGCRNLKKSKRRIAFPEWRNGAPKLDDTWHARPADLFGALGLEVDAFLLAQDISSGNLNASGATFILAAARLLCYHLGLEPRRVHEQPRTRDRG